jgi:hypothetical protein
MNRTRIYTHSKLQRIGIPLLPGQHDIFSVLLLVLKLSYLNLKTIIVVFPVKNRVFDLLLS